MNFPKPPESTTSLILFIVFELTIIAFFFHIGKYYVVDKGYPDRKGYLTPYSRLKYHQSQFEHVLPTNAQEAFNLVLNVRLEC
uniref:Uncharacterized protein n=1 Tax=Lactuca sativa TaxID=4236 RepID=A0A9R1XLC7_LACSA|nr:hypothetical protein LSAT_V11C300144470 [Lactuca sativa]